MAFKITPFYNLDNTPIYHVDMENDVLVKPTIMVLLSLTKMLSQAC